MERPNDPEEAGESSPRVSLLPFRRGASKFAVDVARVRRVVPARDLHALPGAPAFAMGGIRAGHRLEIVIDPDALFPSASRPAPASPAPAAEPAASPRRVVLVAGERDGYGLAADTVDAPIDVSLDAIQDPPPFLGGARRRAILGLLVDRASEMLILDPDRLLEPEIREELERSGAGPA